MNAQPGGAVSRVNPGGGGGGGTLADVLDTVLDKGIVIDAWASVSLLGIEIVSIQAKVIVASVETYLKYAQMVTGEGGLASAKPKQMPVEAAPQKPAERPAAALPEPRPAEHVPSEDELIKYLGEHSSGLRIDQIAEHFHVPRNEVETSVGHLVHEHRVRKDEGRNLFLPVKG
jgi:hypothetical protein